MVKLLLKLRVLIKRILTPIFRLILTLFNDDVSLTIKAFSYRLIKHGKTRHVLISLGLKIGNPGYSCP